MAGFFFNFGAGPDLNRRVKPFEPPQKGGNTPVAHRAILQGGEAIRLSACRI